jgi:hypothetical protein
VVQAGSLRPIGNRPDRVETEGRRLAAGAQDAILLHMGNQIDEA